ncbi:MULTISPECIES: RNA polymerase sigma factor [unclassified Nocardiopsis]|uniref:RNA polymerase sigma factor n=1 Tax=unclassified Nocardiopsis TaxID=2649073 RepID=UPI001F23833A|nr:MULTISPECIES: sigma-70 region 4 domain-containing protein [unclassified Nocardiopsis]
MNRALPRTTPGGGAEPRHHRVPGARRHPCAPRRRVRAREQAAGAGDAPLYQQPAHRQHGRQQGGRGRVRGSGPGQDRSQGTVARIGRRSGGGPRSFRVQVNTQSSCTLRVYWGGTAAPTDAQGHRTSAERARGARPGRGRPGVRGTRPRAPGHRWHRWRTRSGCWRANPGPQRICWVLRETEGLGCEEIAEIVNTTPTAVRGRVHRARTRLVEALKSWR